MKKQILVVAGDPGGANAVAPVIEEFNRDGCSKIIPYAYNEAVGLWESRGINVTALPDNCTIQDINGIIQRIRPDLLLTATSYNSKHYENYFIFAANREGIRSVALLDYWNNYWIRFRDSTGTTFLPNLIAVMDERARVEMIGEGFDPASLIVTGHPAYDDLNVWRERFDAEKREKIRADLGVQKDHLLVLFASEIQYSVTAGEQLYPGYTNVEIITRLIAVLDEISTETGQGITLLIRPHPREDQRMFEGLRGEGIDLIVSGSHHGRDIVLTADLVTGMTTNLMVEACYLGCIVLSLQHQPLLGDPLITNRLGVSKVVYNKKDFKPAVQEVLMDSVVREQMRQRLQAFQADGMATSRVITIIHKMLV